MIHVQGELVFHQTVDIESIRRIVEHRDVVVDQKVMHPNRGNWMGHALELHAVTAALAGNLRRHVGVEVDVQVEALGVRGRIACFVAHGFS